MTDATPDPTPDPAATHTTTDRTALVTGATGYIGGLLVPRLLDAGWRVRVLTRDASKIDDEPWGSRVQPVEGDASQESDLREAMDGVDVAWFLLHSMDGTGDFAARDRELSTAFGRAAKAAGVRRIVYLGGLHPDNEELSEHLASRVEVGQILMDSGVPTACLQAAVVIGDGSASFEMLRHLTERLPAMIAPKWLRNLIQPIAVQDVLHYLVAAADLPDDVNRTFDIGGPDVLSYADMIRRFAKVTGLMPRVVVTVPVLTPGLASYWVGLVTPVDAGVARPLVGSLVHEVVCRERDLDDLVGAPPGGVTGYDDAVRAAMRTAQPQLGPRTVAWTTAATAAAAVAGSMATKPDSRWYAGLDKPAWQPPPVAFPVVWTTLYATIVGAAASAIRTLEDSDRRPRATSFKRAFLANLVLNAGWSALFFRARRLDLATLGAGALAASSADLSRRAAEAGPGHARWLTPYTAWCAFATVLSAELWRRNRH